MMALVILTKLELVKLLREIAASENCHLTLRAASKIVTWLKEDGASYNIKVGLKTLTEKNRCSQES
jgi:hypothetical protein